MNNLIDRLHNFTLDRKLLSVDSIDRDINKCPNPASFEITCPQNYTNVESIRLLEIQIPYGLYNISEQLQNNKLTVKVESDNNEVIILEDGLYTPTLLVTCLQTYLLDISSGFVVTYNELNKKIYFGNETKTFSLLFDKEIPYDNIIDDRGTITNCSNNIYDQHSNWGLGSLLGFTHKKTYNSANIEGANHFSHDHDDWIANDDHIIEGNKQINLNINNMMYLELEKYNTIDEIIPYINNKHSNINSGKINSCFAKISINTYNTNDNNSNSLSAKDLFLDNISYFQPPIEKISKLKFKLRYHNGMLVDLQNFNISMLIEINQIRNEMKDYNVRKPFTI
jgi:hypothetical protein